MKLRNFLKISSPRLSVESAESTKSTKSTNLSNSPSPSNLPNSLNLSNPSNPPNPPSPPSSSLSPNPCPHPSNLRFKDSQLAVRKFRDLINFSLHCSLSVSPILLYFISIRTWVENLHIENLYQESYRCNAELFLQGR